MISNFFKILILYFLLIFPVLSKNFNEILINGNIRISEETIKLFSDIPEDTDFNENSLNLILKNLYKTGFFKDVELKIKDNKLIINVVENPIIQTTFIEGVKTNKIEKAIDDILILKDRTSFNVIDAKKDEISIRKLLKEMGYYFAKISTSVENLNDNKINLTYLIEIGNKAKIKKITFVGKKVFKDSKLKNLIVSEEYKFWKFISGKKFLNENLIALDSRLLKNFYKNNGYYEIVVESSFANYVGNEEFELIFNINAGKKFYFNKITLNLPSDYDEKNFISLTDYFDELKNEPYSLNSIDNIIKKINKITLNEQYEFLSSTVNETIKENLIDFEFNVQDSEKLYVEKINIFGNNITREDVIRNNLVVDEGDAFNNLLHNKSINNIKSLNFFRSVESEIIDGSTSKQKIINISVEEKPTGEISAGAGLGTSGGTIAFSVKENNFLGRGIEFGSNLTVSQESIRGLLLLENPNYNGTDKSLNLTVESTVTDRLTNFGYKSNKTGFSVGSGFEYYEDLFLKTGVSVYVENLKTDTSASNNIQKQKGSYFDTYLNYTFDYDKRNQKFQPSEGFRSRFTQNIPIFSENYSLKNSYNFKNYNDWLNNSILSTSLYLGTVNSITGKNAKLSDRIFIPSNKLRGFEYGKIGPRDGTDYVGGNYAAAFNFSSSIPQIFPNSQNTNFSIFFDAANVWGVDYNSAISDDGKIRSSVGMAIDFFSPIGPLNFSFSEVITKSSSDITESFRFNLGTTF